MLFIGINPRRSNTNLDLHNWLMGSSEAFAQFANNIQEDGQFYIRKCGNERHYDCHMIVVEGVFGLNTGFQTKASVTELMLCASSKMPLILGEKKSPCAQLFLGRVLKIVQPKVIVAVGSTVGRHLEDHFKSEIKVPVVKMEHPRQLYGICWAQKISRMQPTIDRVRSMLSFTR